MATFGIEIELTDPRAREDYQVARALAQALGEGAEVGSVHRAHPFYATRPAVWWKGGYWAMEYDRSITPQGVEIISPILSGDEGIEAVQDVVRAARKIGLRANSSTGVHVHVGASHLSEAGFRRLISRWLSIEPLAIAVFRRTGVRWAKPMPLDLYRAAISGTLARATLEEVALILNNTAPSEQRCETGEEAVDAFLARHYHKARYKAMNLVAFWQKGTVEFRIFQFSKSLPHAGEAKTFIQFALAMVREAARGTRFSRAHLPTPGRPLKEIWRAFLVHLGLTGPKYKTLRLHAVRRRDWGQIERRLRDLLDARFSYGPERDAWYTITQARIVEEQEYEYEG